jgi:hypothetical protein
VPRGAAKVSSEVNGCAASRRVLLIGDTGRHEFRGVQPWLACHSRLVVWGSPECAVVDGAAIDCPDVIVLAQSWPGQWSEEVVESLHRTWPLARLVALVGGWCEGEGRSGRPLRGVWRIHWSDWERRLLRFLGSAGGAAADGLSWNLPRLATDQDRLEYDLRIPRVAVGSDAARPGAGGGAGRMAVQVRGSHGGEWVEWPGRWAHARGLVVICARSRLAFESLSEACECVGYCTSWQRPGEGLGARGARVAIWDAREGGEREWGQIAAFAGQIAPASTIVAIGFPRPPDLCAAARLGGRVLAKPFQLPDLWDELQVASGAAGATVTTARTGPAAKCSTPQSQGDYNHRRGVDVPVN